LLAGALGSSSSGAEDLFVLHLTETVDGRAQRMRWPYAAVRQFRGAATSFESLATYTTATVNLTGTDQASRIDIALGARPGQLVVASMTSALTQAGLGVMAGIVVAVAAARALRAILFGVGPNDPAALAISAAVMIVVAIIAAWLPAHRAFGIDPVEQLRAD
jgi:ABC-type antimicrobial peptide transport system permease subunit